MTSTNIGERITAQPFLLVGLMLGQIAVVVTLSAGINKLTSSAAYALFFLYSALSGITLSPIVLAYTKESLFITFLVSAATFGIMAFYGLVTRTNLMRFGSILTMLLVGLVISLLINLFFQSSTADLIMSGIGVILFSALIAYDSQVLKNYALNAQENDENFKKFTIIAALKLYLDLINLFLFLLRFLGKRKED